MDNRITQLFNITYPIIQAGMIWASGWRLASAVSNAGGLGLIGSGSMYPEVLRQHIQKCKTATTKPFGVNVPLLYPDIDKHIDVIIEEKVPIVPIAISGTSGLVFEDSPLLSFRANIRLEILEPIMPETFGDDPVALGARAREQISIALGLPVDEDAKPVKIAD